MIIAIATENNKVCDHFGHCEGFTLVKIENNKVIEKSYIENPGHKPGFLPIFLHEKNVNTIISGGMGKGAIDIFKEKNINVITGANGDINTLIDNFIKGKIKSSNSICNKHEHEGNCGN